MPSNASKPFTLVVPIAIGLVIGTGCGLLCALFVFGLGHAEAARTNDPRWLFVLPPLGLALGLVHERFGRTIEGGNNLVIDRLCDGGPPLPRRMVAFNLFGTVAIHLCGGSVGQEGAALQIGASLADGLGHAVGFAQTWRRATLVAGVAGAFGAVFNAPAAGAVFALEFAVAGAITSTLLPCAVVAALTGQAIVQRLVPDRIVFPPLGHPAFTLEFAARWMVVALSAMAAATAFMALQHFMRKISGRLMPYRPLRMGAGGALVVAAAYLLHTDRYLGGGLGYTLYALGDGSVPQEAWLIKLMLTALCLGVGFGGGEVTPLLFVGATLGHAMAPILGLPQGLAAAVSMVAVLASATRSPLAWALLAVEWMGASILPHALFTCVIAVLVSGRHRLYEAQRGHPAQGAHSA